MIAMGSFFRKKIRRMPKIGFNLFLHLSHVEKVV